MIKKIIICALLVLSLSITYAQTTKVVIQYWPKSEKSDTTMLFYKVDTMKIDIYFIDSLNFMKFSPGIYVISGYSNGEKIGYYVSEIKEQYFVLDNKKKYFEIPTNKIYQTKEGK